MILRVDGVSKTFGGFVAVDNVSFEILRGEVLGIAGPNGAGKSTLFNLISGIPFRASSGSIEFDGVKIERTRPETIARRGLMRTFQAEQLFGTLTVEENLAVSGAYLRRRGTRKQTQQKIEEVVEQIGLGNHLGQLAADVPVLIKKKLMIATALVAEPQLLMLDEPAGGLDTEDQQELITLLEELNRGGLTLLIIEHVLSLLRALAGRMVVMAAGTVIAEGTPEAALNHPDVVEAYLGGAAS